MGHGCVANLTHMLQTSSFNQTHVLVASNSISLFFLEGRIYIITLLNPLPVLIILLNPLPVLVVLLNPLPVLVALKILREILSFTRSFMINTRPLIWCLKNSDQKVKEFHVIPQIASSRLVYCSSMCTMSFECVWFCNVTPDLYHKTVTQQTWRLPNGLARIAFIIFSNKFGLSVLR